MSKNLLIGCGTTIVVIVLIFGFCAGLAYWFISPHIISGFYLRDGKVFYSEGIIGGKFLIRSKHLHELTEADYASFKILERGFAKDKNTAYFKTSKILNSHPASFKIIKGFYAADQRSVYHKYRKISDSPQNFRIVAQLKNTDLHDLYATDGEKVFRDGLPFFPDKIDAATFENINQTRYFRDKNNVYLPKKLIEGADPQTFRVLPGFEDNYAVDRVNVYYDGQLVEGCDVKTHQIIDRYRHRDHLAVYVRTKKISDDPENFSVLSKDGSEGYTKDGKNVYWNAQKVSEDAANFEIFPAKYGKGFARDSKFVYWCADRMDEIDAESFKYLNEHYVKDKNNVYFVFGSGAKPRLIKNADAATFEIYAGGKQLDARDKNTYYYRGYPKRK